MNSKSKKIVDKSLSETVRIINLYDSVIETITNQKLGQTLNYKPLSATLDDVIHEAENIRKVLNKNKIEIANLDDLLGALIFAVKSYATIVEGLAMKANRTGSYGFFRYRGDLKRHNKLRDELIIERLMLASHIKTPEEDIEVTAFILTPSGSVLEEKITIPMSNYTSFGDGKGNVYILRTYEAGEPEDSLMEYKMWKSTKKLFTSLG